MPASLMLVSGPAAGSEYLITSTVFRVGGDHSCDVVFEGLPAECVTLRFEEGEYHVTNRSDLICLLESQPLGPGETGVWNDGEDLEIGPQYQLRLEILGDPAPPMPAADETVAIESPAADEAEAPPKKSRLMEWCGLALCGLAILVLLTEEESSSANAPPGVMFDITIRSLTNAIEHQAGNHMVRLRQLLQHGRVAEIRGRPQEAVLFYRQAVKQIELLESKQGRGASAADGTGSAEKISADEEPTGETGTGDPATGKTGTGDPVTGDPVTGDEAAPGEAKDGKAQKLPNPLKAARSYTLSRLKALSPGETST